MNKVAIAFSTKDRVELSEQTMVPLAPRGGDNEDFDLFWVDGSVTEEGENLPHTYSGHFAHCFWNVRGGADAAIVFSLTTMLQHPNNYTHIGLVENDVLLDPDWFAPVMALFETGNSEGLVVGAVSARCYEDRILIQRENYAVCHNLGAGMVIFTREAAELVLKQFRNGWWADNRRTFMQLSGLDIGKWGAFGTNEQFVTADWHFDNVLAQHGLASLALTPAKCFMIGQIPPLAEQGLKLVTESVGSLRNESAFASFVDRTRAVREENLRLVHCDGLCLYQAADGSRAIFPHQVASFGGKFAGDWQLKWAQGFGPFAWKARLSWEAPAMLTVPISGPCTFLVSGGEKGGKAEIVDKASGYKVSPDLPPEQNMQHVLSLPVPAGISYREIVLTTTPGVTFYGIQVRDPQPWLPEVKFTHATLPPP